MANNENLAEVSRFSHQFARFAVRTVSVCSTRRRRRIFIFKRERRLSEVSHFETTVFAISIY